MGPVHYVVRVAPVMGPAASRESTSAVAGHDGAPQPDGDDLRAPSHVERL
jgi:hypothetical protein